jgi:hypothetical protein
VGSDGPHYGAGDFPAKCILPVKLTSAGYKKEDNHGSSDGLHQWRRDIEYGMVAVYEFDDVEYRSFDRGRRVVGHRDGSGDTGAEGVERLSSTGERRYLECGLCGRVVCCFLCASFTAAGFEDQEDLLRCWYTHIDIKEQDAGRWSKLVE